MCANPFSPYREAPAEPPKPMREPTAAELKAKADLLKMLGEAPVREVAEWLKTNQFANELKLSHTVLSHVQQRIMRVLEYGKEEPGNWIKLFPEALDPKLQAVARQKFLAELSVRDWIDWHDLLGNLSKFKLTHDVEFLKGVESVMVKAIGRERHNFAIELVERFDLPDAAGNLRPQLKTLVEKSLAVARFPLEVLKKYPELAHEKDVQESAKIFVRFDLLKEYDKDFFWIEQVNKFFGDEVFKDPSVLRALQLREAEMDSRNERQRGHLPGFLLERLSPEERTEAKALALLEVFSKGLPGEGVTGENSYRLFSNLSDYKADPRMLPAAKDCLYRSKPWGSITNFLDILDVYPELSDDPKVRALAKEVAVSRLKERETFWPEKYWDPDQIKENKKNDEHKLFKINRVKQLLSRFPGLSDDKEIRAALRTAK